MGVDGGCVGATTGVYESDLTLKYSKILATQLMKLNISSVLTRQDEKGLYEEGTTNLKKSDMQKRKHIIEQNKPNLVVSIHMNSYKLPSVKGLQTFYKKGNTSGKILGDIVQHELHSFVPYANETAKVGDFFIVNCTNIPAILVECGFLSNREEELKLIDKDYQIKICHSIASGIVKFLNEKKYGTN